jgi:hypothetical protein
MLANPVPGQLDRLIKVQHALIDIINFLDPECIRFSKAHIKRLDVSELVVEQKRDSSARSGPQVPFMTSVATVREALPSHLASRVLAKSGGRRSAVSTRGCGLPAVSWAPPSPQHCPVGLA